MGFYNKDFLLDSDNLPPVDAEVDRSHPFMQDLDIATYFRERAGNPVELNRELKFQFSNSLAKWNPQGVSVAGNNACVVSTTDYSRVTNVSYGAVLRYIAPAYLPVPLDYRYLFYNGSFTSWAFYWDERGGPATGNWVCNSAAGPSISTPFDGKWHTVIWNFDNTTDTHTVIEDGGARITQVDRASGTQTGPLRIGGRDDGTNRFSGCVVAYARIHTKPIPQNLWAPIHEDPYAPFIRGWYIPVISGPAPIALNVDNLTHEQPVDQVNLIETELVQVFLHRERIAVSGTTWQVRPPAMAGLTPKAAIVYGQGMNTINDDTPQGDASFFIGMTDGVVSYSRHAVANHNQSDGQNCYSAEAADRLIYATSTGGSIRIQLFQASLVNGGLDVNVDGGSFDRPYVNFIFFVGDSIQTFMNRTPGLTSGLRNVTTFFTGSNNDNQIAFFLPSLTGTPTSIRQTLGDRAQMPTLGVAVRQGAAGPPAFQFAHSSYADQSGSGPAVATSVIADNRCIQEARRLNVGTALECTDISDASFQLTWRSGGVQVGAYTMVLSLGSTRAWAGLVDSPNVDQQTWTVNQPNFPTRLAFIAPTQVTTPQDILQISQIAIGGFGAAAGDDAYCASWNNEDDALPTKALVQQDNRFINFLQDSGIPGWKADIIDLHFTNTGFYVNNVDVAGGTPGTIRKWPVIALEGPPYVTLDTDDVQHAHPVDIANLVPSTYRLDSEALVHAQPVDAIALTKPNLLTVNDATHVQPVDQCNVIIQAAGFLSIDDLAHVQPVEPSYFGQFLRPEDAINVQPVDSVTITTLKGLTVDDLVHVQPIDQANLTGLPISTLFADDLVHVQPVDSPALPKQTPIAIQGLEHLQPVERVDLTLPGQTYPYINAAKGTLLLTWKPRYAKADLVLPFTAAIAGLQTGTDVLLRMVAAAPNTRFESTDGTSVVSVVLAGVDEPRLGISYRIALRWDADTPTRQVGYKPSDGPWVWGTAGSHDGQFGSGALRLFYNNQYPQLISDMLIYSDALSTSEIEDLPMEI